MYDSIDTSDSERNSKFGGPVTGRFRQRVFRADTEEHACSYNSDLHNFNAPNQRARESQPPMPEIVAA